MSRHLQADFVVEFQKSHDIAAGKAEAILIAAEASEWTVLLIDERRARRVAIDYLDSRAAEDILSLLSDL